MNRNDEVGHTWFKTLNGMSICKKCGIAKKLKTLKQKCKGYKLSQKIIDFADKEIPE